MSLFMLLSLSVNLDALPDHHGSVVPQQLVLHSYLCKILLAVFVVGIESVGRLPIYSLHHWQVLSVTRAQI